MAGAFAARYSAARGAQSGKPVVVSVAQLALEAAIFAWAGESNAHIAKLLQEYE